MQNYGMHSGLWKIWERMVISMKKRSGFVVMLRLIGLVKPLTGFMILAIMMGLVGHLLAAFITIFGGYALAETMGIHTPFTITVL